MRRLAAFIAALTIFSFACGLFTPASNPDIQPAPPIETIPAPETSTPIPTFTVQAPTVAAPPPAATAPEADYFLKEERLIKALTTSC